MLLNTIVVGSCLQSATYALLKDAFYLDTCILGPMFYENLKLKFLGFDRADKTKSRILLSLSLQGKLLSYTEQPKIKITDDTIKISDGSRVFKYSFNLCEIFDPYSVDFENDAKIILPQKFKVFDDFELSNLGSKHKYLKPKHLAAPGPAHKIIFYTSDRVHGAKYVTDCVVESVLSREQLNKVEFSDSMIRFYVERHLSNLGIHGTFMNFYKNGSPKYRRPKVIHRGRFVVPTDESIYCDSEKVKFKSLSLEEVFNEFCS